MEAAGGRVITVETLAHKADMAAGNFARSGLGAFIQLVRGDAGEFLVGQPRDAYDLVFLDADRSRYVGWWPDLYRILSPGGLMVADNAISHASELESFRALVEESPGWITSLVPVGKGEWLALKPYGA